MHVYGACVLCVCKCMQCVGTCECACTSACVMYVCVCVYGHMWGFTAWYMCCVCAHMWGLMCMCGCVFVDTYEGVHVHGAYIVCISMCRHMWGYMCMVRVCVCVHTFKGACAWCITDKCKMFDGDEPYLQLSSLGGQIGSEYLFLRYWCFYF